MTHPGDETAIQLRRGTEDDIDDLLVIEDECFSVYYYGQYKFGRDEFLYYLYRSRCTLLVAVVQARVVGYTAAVVRRRRGGPLAHIDSIAVLPEYRRNGAGGRLLASVLREARLQGCRTATLEVAVANTEGRTFFNAHGFREIRTLANYYGKGLHGILMTASLRNPPGPNRNMPYDPDRAVPDYKEE